ncbi:MAG: hypothetical protein RJR34_06700 [Candidatus Methanoculleus thermohydrogenotrophicum]|mgnify:CR=1 FL=1|jgi:hypothetical protein|nr:hypothetical protein [Candidatus Methanoculleus thermohydrogenotrophicum]
MCTPIHHQACSCHHGPCGCMQSLTIEEEIAMLEAQKKRMQVMIDMTDRRIESLKKRA